MTDKQKPADLPAIEARLAAATPGPWRRLFDGDTIWSDGVFVALVRNSDGIYRHPNAPKSQQAADNADLIARAPADLLALVAEVRRLRHDDAIWDKHSLVQIVTERDELRGEVKRLQSLLETEQCAKWATEQDKQHWWEEAERLRLQVAQLAEALEVAGGMPEKERE